MAGTTFAKDAHENDYFEASVKKNDTLILGSIGYISLKMSAEKFPDTIFLERAVINLEPIVILKKSNETYGIINEKKDRSSAGSTEGTRREFATLIEIPNTIRLFKISKVFV